MNVKLKNSLEIMDYLNSKEVFKNCISGEVTDIAAYMTCIDFEEIKSIFNKNIFLHIEWFNAMQSWKKKNYISPQYGILAGVIEIYLGIKEIKDISHAINPLFFREEEFIHYTGYLGYDNPVSKKRILRIGSLDDFIEIVNEDEEENNDYRNLEKYENLTKLREYIFERTEQENITDEDVFNNLFNSTQRGSVFVDKGVIYFHHF